MARSKKKQRQDGASAAPHHGRTTAVISVSDYAFVKGVIAGYQRFAFSCQHTSSLHDHEVNQLLQERLHDPQRPPLYNAGYLVGWMAGLCQVEDFRYILEQTVQVRPCQRHGHVWCFTLVTPGERLCMTCGLYAYCPLCTPTLPSGPHLVLPCLQHRDAAAPITAAAGEASSSAPTPEKKGGDTSWA